MYSYLKGLLSGRSHSPSEPVEPTGSALSPAPLKEVIPLTPTWRPLLEASSVCLPPDPTGRPTLVIDLDETLVHSSFGGFDREPDLSLDLDIDGQYHNIQVLFRPYAEEFLARLSHHYEIVIFTASLSLYAMPVVSALDREGVVASCLSRQHCVYHSFFPGHGGTFVKDLARLGRPLERTLLVDNSPVSYLYQPDNGVPCSSWLGDAQDTELVELCDFLIHIAGEKDLREAVRATLSGSFASVATPQVHRAHVAARRELSLLDGMPAPSPLTSIIAQVS